MTTSDQSPENPTSESPTPEPSATESSAQGEKKPARSIKIGSQRSSAQAPKPRPASAPMISKPAPAAAPAQEAPAAPTDGGPDDGADETSPLEQAQASVASTPVPVPTIEVPSDENEYAVEMKPTELDLDAEIEAALGGASIDDLMGGSQDKKTELALDSRLQATVIKTDRESVFFSMGDQYEGIAPHRQFKEMPDVGSTVEVIITGFSAADGLYEVAVPGSSVEVADWSDLQEGVAVEAKITGKNTGGLECEVNKIRGFIPISQISMYRVEANDLETYIDQKIQCIVTEANADRRNLVLSHRALMEREREAAKEQLMEELEVGQTREGVVRRLQDFGAFVDIGGVDGLIHVSQLSWDRIKHPSEVIEEGQKVKVRIEKIDPATGRIGLSYRDLLEDPWEDIDSRFPAGAIVNGTVSKLMDFGAFVKLSPGVEGLVHISELAHHRVTRVNLVVREGQDVDVKVLSVDKETQRIALSMKAVNAAPATSTKSEEVETDDPAAAAELKKLRESTPDLKGGTSRSSGGDQFGLKW